MRQLRYGQGNLCDGFWAREVGDLWPKWMRVADDLLDDEALIELIYEAQGKRHPMSRTRGRRQTPAEVVLRMLVLKHAHDWSFDETVRQVRANVVHREFARVGIEKVPDDKTLLRIAKFLGPEVIKGIHERIVTMAKEKKVVPGRRLRVDTTVVETNIHHPTDSSLLGDASRVLTRLMKKVKAEAGELVSNVRDRMRSVQKKVVAIAISSRRTGPEGEKQRQGHYQKLLRLTRQVKNQAVRMSQEVQGLAEESREPLVPLVTKLASMVEHARRVIRQTKARIFEGNTKVENKLVSVFEPHTEIIRKGKASKPTEFGKMVKIQEAEGQIIVDYEVFDERPSDSDLLVASVRKHQELLERTPILVAADSAFYSAANERELEQMNVHRTSVPNRATKSEARKAKQKLRWFKNGQRWRTGCEGRISVLKRRHGLNRSRYRGAEGIKKWVGLGVIADNLISLGRLLDVVEVQA